MQNTIQRITGQSYKDKSQCSKDIKMQKQKPWLLWLEIDIAKWSVSAVLGCILAHLTHFTERNTYPCCSSRWSCRTTGNVFPTSRDVHLAVSRRCQEHISASKEPSTFSASRDMPWRLWEKPNHSIALQPQCWGWQSAAYLTPHPQSKTDGPSPRTALVTCLLPLPEMRPLGFWPNWYFFIKIILEENI